MSKYQPYSDYKKTQLLGFDSIPSEWLLKKIKFQFKIGRGRVISEEELVDEGMFPVFSSQTKNNGCLGYLNTYDFDCEQITWTTDGANAGTIFLRQGKHNCTNVCGTLIPKAKNISMAFSKYCLEYAAQFHKRPDTNGAKIMNNEMAEITISQPSIFEQKQIANFLDHETAKIDQLIVKQQQLIKLLKEKRQAVISHAVTKGLNPNAPMKDSGVEWLGEVPAHWRVTRIKNLAKIISKGTTPSTVGGEFIDEGIRFLKAENIGKSMFVKKAPEFFITDIIDKQLSRSRLVENDVLVIIAGATTGMASILQKNLLPANTNQAVSFIRPKDKLYSKLIIRWLSTEFAQRIIWMEAVQAAQPNLSMEDLGNIPVIVPPVKELIDIFEEIDKYLSRLIKLHSKAKMAIKLMKERRTALISAAVTGKIDVRDWKPPHDN